MDNTRLFQGKKTSQDYVQGTGIIFRHGFAIAASSNLIQLVLDTAGTNPSLSHMAGRSRGRIT